MKHHPPTCGASDGTQSHEDVYVSIWFECAGVMHAGNTSLQHSFIFITVIIIVIVLLFLSPHSLFMLSCWVLLSMAELILN
ncbi:hypothetical protein NQZ68_004145 [Dissostichus eleginoides]|nr:hypothetical protein NQZ68_004145 [Dissostichus eleginoides]